MDSCVIFAVPVGLRETYLKQLLAIHQAAPKMIARAFQSLWWPFMKKEITNFGKTCKTCKQYKPSNPTEDLRDHEPATYPFHYIYMDIIEHLGTQYLTSSQATPTSLR
jgi:hypothetical protein